ncbi:MAG: Lrp/AsnC family transcriptional regulator [Phormidesmis sp.]
MKKSLRIPEYTLDNVDTQLLRILHQDARTSIADIARELNMSSPSVSERLKRLKESGVIRAFTITVDPQMLGYALSFYIRIRPLPGQLSKVVSVIQASEEIVECNRVTGDDCFISKVHIRSTDELEQIINRLLPYAQTNTSLIQSSPIQQRLPPFAEG